MSSLTVPIPLDLGPETLILAQSPSIPRWSEVDARLRPKCRWWLAG